MTFPTDPSVGVLCNDIPTPIKHARRVYTSDWNVVTVPSTGMLSPLPLGCVLTDMAKRGIVPVFVVALLTKLQNIPGVPIACLSLFSVQGNGKLVAAGVHFWN